MDINGSASESVEGNEKYIPVYERKEDQHDIVTENITELCPSCGQQELVSNEIQESSKHCTEDVACVFSLPAVKYESKHMRRE